jgi:hypothetical protein
MTNEARSGEWLPEHLVAQQEVELGNSGGH